MMTCRCYSLAVVPALIVVSACAVRTTAARHGGGRGAAVCECSYRRRADGAGHERGALRRAHSHAGGAQHRVRGRAVHDRAAICASLARRAAISSSRFQVEHAEVVVGAHYDAARLADGTSEQRRRRQCGIRGDPLASRRHAFQGAAARRRCGSCFSIWKSWGSSALHSSCRPTATGRCARW